MSKSMHTLPRWIRRTATGAALPAVRTAGPGGGVSRARPATGRRGSAGLALLALLGLLAVSACRSDGGEPPAELPPLPPTPPTLAAGEVLYAASCQQCHGAAAAGTSQGPPLAHRIYEPGHHGDAAFLLAARNGVRAHHWQFGDMPAQPQVTDAEVAEITAWVRWVQRQRGIE